MRTLRILPWIGLFAAASICGQDIEIQIELSNQVGTATSWKGDLVAGRVLSPASLVGDTVDGKVTESRSGAKMGGQSVLTIQFDTLRHGGAAIPINTQLKSVANSRGNPNMGEEGRVLRRAGGNVARASTGSGLGSMIGGLAGGRTGSAIGAAAGGLTAAVLVEVASDAPNITFAPGSRFVLTARSRSGPSLASLPSNPAPAVATAPPPAPPSQAAATNAPAATPSAVAPAPTPTASKTAAPAQPNLTAVKADFIPGEKAILVDDFTDMAGDEPPPHWKVRGGTAELRVGEGVRQLTFTARRTDLTPNITGLPKNFTMEIDMRIVGHDDVVNWEFKRKTGAPALVLRFHAIYAKLGIYCAAGAETLTDQQIPMDWTRPIKTALWLQNGRMRLYVNGERVFDANQIDLGDVGTPTAAITVYADTKAEKFVGIQYARFAESTPDFSQVITSSGRYVSHGILFDTDSDRLKPESGPVIKMVARALETNPNLKLEIEACGVDATIAVQTRQTLHETKWLLELAQSNPFVAGVVGWVPVRKNTTKNLVCGARKQ